MATYKWALFTRFYLYMFRLDVVMMSLSLVWETKTAVMDELFLLLIRHQDIINNNAGLL